MAHRMPLKDIEFTRDLITYARGRGKDKYDFNSNAYCAVAQFLRDTGRAAEPRVIPTDWRDGLHSTERFPLPHGMNRALNNEDDNYNRSGWRFDLLADRLEALLIDAPMVEKVS